MTLYACLMCWLITIELLIVGGINWGSDDE
jgi:uncharacterized membrane protein YuzA (DUF378 family)